MNECLVVIMDAPDRALLTELARDARTSHVELSGRVGLSPTACARRLKLLEEAGIVTGYRAIFDMRPLGMSMTLIIRVSLRSQSEETPDAFERVVAACGAVLRCFLVSGSDDCLLLVTARDMGDFERVHRRQLSRLPGVARIDISFAIREVLDPTIPPAVRGS